MRYKVIQVCVTMSILALTVFALAQPPANAPTQPAQQGGGRLGRFDREQMLQRMIQIAEQQGDKELVERLKSNDPQVRQQAVGDFMQKYRNQLGGGMGFVGGMLGGPVPPAPPVAIATTDKYLFIVRGDTVFQLDINTLEILKQQELPRPAPPQRPAQPPQ